MKINFILLTVDKLSHYIFIKKIIPPNVKNVFIKNND